METRRENKKRVEDRLRTAGLPLWPIPAEADTTLLGYPILTSRKARTLAEARRRKLDISGGFDRPVYPLNFRDLADVDYVSGCCPRAERLARQLVHIPTASTVIDHTLRYATEVLSPQQPMAS